MTANADTHEDDYILWGQRSKSKEKYKHINSNILRNFKQMETLRFIFKDNKKATTERIGDSAMTAPPMAAIRRNLRCLIQAGWCIRLPHSHSPRHH